MTVFSFVLLLFLLSASIPLVVRTNVVALLIFLPIILRCFLLNVNNTFEDDDENDVGVGVDVAIQQKKSLEQTPPVLGPSGRGMNRAHKKNVHKVTQFLSLSFSFSRRRKRRRGRRRPCDEYSFEMERFWYFPLQGKKTASRSNVTCAFTFSQRARLRKKTMSSEEVVEENNALWRLFRNAGEFSGGVCRDVVEKHVLPRLNSNDVKFLYGVNTETRKLIKRSSRKGELKERFKVREMSSISTLEVAWENKSLWPGDWEKGISFCNRVVLTNKLELLKWAREEKECEWDYKTINTAAEQGNLEMVQYCVANQCPMDGRACAYAAESGNLEILKYLHEEAEAAWDLRTATWAARNGHLHILEYLVERKFDQYNEVPCRWAAMNGHLDCLKYLHETAKAPWNSLAVREAHRNNHSECLQYLLYNDCPLPTGWSYEGGTLRTS